MTKEIKEEIQSYKSYLTEVPDSPSELSPFQIYQQRLKVNDPELTEIKLNNKMLGYREIEALAKALKVNQTVTKLNLKNTKIGDGEVRHIPEALKVNSTLTEIYLEDNNISSVGAKEIAEVIRINNNLRKINL